MAVRSGLPGWELCTPECGGCSRDNAMSSFESAPANNAARSRRIFPVHITALRGSYREKGSASAVWIDLLPAAKRYENIHKETGRYQRQSHRALWTAGPQGRLQDCPERRPGSGDSPGDLPPLPRRLYARRGNALSQDMALSERIWMPRCNHSAQSTAPSCGSLT